MSDRRIVIEEPCEHGRTVPHSWGGPPIDPDWTLFPHEVNLCPGGSCTVLEGFPDEFAREWFKERGVVFGGGKEEL